MQNKVQFKCALRHPINIVNVRCQWCFIWAASVHMSLWVSVSLLKWSVYDAILMDLLTYQNMNSFHLMDALKKTIKHHVFLTRPTELLLAIAHHINVQYSIAYMYYMQTNGQHKRVINVNSAWQTVHKSGLLFVLLFFR